MSAGTPEAAGYSLYGLVDEHASGILVSWFKYARNTGDYSVLEEYCDTAVRSFLYNGGRGKLIAIAELVKRRNKQRNAALGALRRKKGRGKSGPNILDDINQDALEQSDFLKALKILDGGHGGRGNYSFRYRELVWDITQRGKMGENLLHICLLHNTAEQNELARFIVRKYPKLVNDIFVSEDYYGLSPLHQAIVNEDLEMVYFLLKNNADVHQSQMYWGEYPLSFAACTNQTDCFRLLRAFKADPNRADTNGNTVLHLTVIHDLPEMFTLAFQLGAGLHIRNNQKLTPLALAAKLASKKMYDLILRFETDVVWRYGDVVCEAYSLEDIDTIRQETGMLNRTSVLASICYGDKASHLDFFDGLIEEVLRKKWETFARKRLFRSLFWYLCFLLVLYTSFMTRDLHFMESDASNSTEHSLDVDSYENRSLLEILQADLAFDVVLRTRLLAATPEHCHLWRYDQNSWKGQTRLIAESLSLLGVLLRTMRDILDIQRSGYGRWMKIIEAFPEKVLHKLCQLLMLPARLLCVSCGTRALIVENILAITVVVMTSLHFLFYCRGLKFVGPFVLMVYKIIVGDMLRFLMIYTVFITAFAQAFYLVFQSCERAERAWLAANNASESAFENVVSTPFEAIMRMFIMSVGEFSVFYKNLNECRSWLGVLGKCARVILMLEQSLSPSERLFALYSYSRPLKADKMQRAIVVRSRRPITTEELRCLEGTRKKASFSRPAFSPLIQLNGSQLNPEHVGDRVGA